MRKVEMKTLLIGIGILCLVLVVPVMGAETPISMHHNFGDICEVVLAPLVPLVPEESAPHVLLKLTLSKDVTHFYINEELSNFIVGTEEGSGSQPEVLRSVPLKMGANLFELKMEFTDTCTTHTMIITRQGTMPEDVEIDLEKGIDLFIQKIELFIPLHRDTLDDAETETYWLHYYYDENKNLVGKSIKSERLSFFHEMARCYLLGIIDEALLEATKDTPDYIGEYKIHFQNSISLQTLRSAIQETNMIPTVDRRLSGGPAFYVGKKYIGDPTYFSWKYEDRKWILEPDRKYTRTILGYMNQVSNNSTGKGFGMHLEDDPGKGAPAPVITLGNFERKTNLPIVLLKLELSDDVVAFYINDELYSFPMDWYFTEILEPVPLEMGENVFELRAVNFAGHETMRTVTVTREGEMPEYVEMDGYWRRYYYDENGNFHVVSIHGNSNPAFVKPSDASDKEARSYLLGVIDEALLAATEGTSDYKKYDGSSIHFKNSIFLQTLRDAIEGAELFVQCGITSLRSDHLVLSIGDTEIKWTDVFYFEYPDGTWWMGKADSRYVSLLDEHISKNVKNGGGLGAYTQIPQKILSGMMWIFSEISKICRATNGFFQSP